MPVAHRIKSPTKEGTIALAAKLISFLRLPNRRLTTFTFYREFLPAQKMAVPSLLGECFPGLPIILPFNKK